MPQTVWNGSTNKVILVAQAGEGGGPTPIGEETHGETHAGVEHEGAENPLAEHPAYYYSGMGFGISLLIIIVAGILVKQKTRKPGKGQLWLEQAVASMRHFCRSVIGPGGENYAPLVGTLFIFILMSNLCGVLPFYWIQHKPGAVPVSFTPAPTSNLSITIALGLLVFGVFNYAGIKANGLGNYLKHFAGPIPALALLIFPIELVGMLVRPVSLAMRLFGNVFGEETVIAVLIGLLASIFIPIHTPMLAFGVFGSVVQAGVFAILTCSYIALAIGDHAEHAEHGAGDHGHGDHAPTAVRAH